MGTAIYIQAKAAMQQELAETANRILVLKKRAEALARAIESLSGVYADVLPEEAGAMSMRQEIKHLEAAQRQATQVCAKCGQGKHRGLCRKADLRKGMPIAEAEQVPVAALLKEAGPRIEALRSKNVEVQDGHVLADATMEDAKPRIERIKQIAAAKAQENRKAHDELKAFREKEKEKARTGECPKCHGPMGRSPYANCSVCMGEATSKALHAEPRIGRTSNAKPAANLTPGEVKELVG